MICAIINYNAGGSLVPLLKRILSDDFDHVYVLDDASTDDTLLFLREFMEDITLIAGDKNLGPAGNRNRILEQLKPDDIVLFVDADMELRSTDNVSKIRNAFKEEKAGIVGGFIVDKANKPMLYNYGPITKRGVTWFGYFLESIARVLPKKLVKKLKPFARKYTGNLDIKYGQPFTHKVGCVAEALMAVQGELFFKLKGFDSSLIYHEGVDLAARAHKLGYEVIFTPELEARHLENNVRKNKKKDRTSAKRLLYKKLK